MKESKNNLVLELQNKKVIVFGLGVSGISALRFLSLFNLTTIAVNSQDKSIWAKQPGIVDYVKLENCFSEEEALLQSIFDQADLVILSPGIPRDHPLLKGVLSKNVPIWGEIELAYRYLESTQQLSYLIGITGTNGKTTTTTFLGEMIAKDNKKVFVGGNIGVPFCDYAFDVFHKSQLADFLLLELSSFQLESIDHFHLDCAAILNIFQNHGERYTSIEDYARSKFCITNRFTKDDLLLIPSEFSLILNWAQSQEGLKKVINTKNPQFEIDISNFRLPGVHNKANLAFVLAIASHIKLSTQAIEATVSEFSGVHHRIEPVTPRGSLLNLKCFNDAKSTNWDATVTAVAAMEEFGMPLFLIIGGKKRGHGDSIKPYLDYFKARVSEFLLIGEMADEISSELDGEVLFHNVGTLDKAIEFLGQRKLKTGTILFSPAFPSFDQYRNYAHRGEHFLELVNKNH